MKIYNLELGDENFYYSSLTALCRDQELNVSKFTLDRHNFNTPYVGKNFVIKKGILKGTGDVQKKMTLQDELKIIESEHQLTKTDEKINLVPGNYVKKGNLYYFNFDGSIYKGSANLDFWLFGLTRLKNSKKIFGEIKDIMFS